MADVPFTVSPPPAPSHRNAVLLTIAGVVFVTLIAGWYVYTRDPAPEPNPQAAYDAGDLDTALAQIDELLKHHPENVGMLVFKSTALSQKGNLSFKEFEYGTQAAVTANEALSLASKSSAAYFALGLAKEMQRSYEEAHAAYQTALSVESKNYLAHMGDARVYEIEGNMPRAEAGYEAALEVNPGATGAHIGLGRVNARRSNPETALLNFRTAYERTVNMHERAQAAYGIGMLLVSEGDLEGARELLETATKIEATYPSAWFGLGVAYYVKGTVDSTAATERMAYLSASEDALTRAVLLTPIDSDPGAHVQFPLDLSVLQDSTPALAALNALSASIPAADEIEEDDKSAFLARISAFTELVKNGPPGTNP